MIVTKNGVLNKVKLKLKLIEISLVTVDCSQHLYFSMHVEEKRATRARSTSGWG